MKIYVIAVGKLKDTYLIEAEKYYLGSIQKTAEIKIIEIKEDHSKEIEGEKIISRIPPGTESLLLDVKGKKINEIDFDNKIKDIKERDASLTFIIGGSEGFGENVYRRVGQRISFSSMTFPHRIARILLLDQLKRALTAI
jgi:23S rRNA (pseudouridine1915-N3)-methyltransferase